MKDFLRRRIEQQPKQVWAQVLCGLIIAALAIGVRLGLMPLIQGAAPFITFFPAVLVASILAGAPGGFTCLIAGALASGLLFFPHIPGVGLHPAVFVAQGVFLVSGGAIVMLAAMLRSALLDLSAAREQERLMLHELQHRVKNTLAVVQALAAQSLQAASDPPAFKREFTDRLVALAQAHNLLSDAVWTEVSLRAVVERTLAPFVAGQPGRLSVEGEDVTLPPDHVVSLALCLHELRHQTPTKYGALSDPQGRVAVTWLIARRKVGGRIRLEWSEHDGPPVVQPRRKGFGSRLLRQGLSNRARPVVEMTFAPDGLRWTAEFDVEPEAAFQTPARRGAALPSGRQPSRFMNHRY